MAKVNVPMLTVNVTKQVNFACIVSQLCSAFEGGSNYWYWINKNIKPKNFNNSEKDYIKYPHLSYPINEGGALIISVKEEVDEDMAGKTFILNLKSIQKGLRLLAAKYPHHFEDLVTQDGDATTGDVFLQLCIFGEIIW